MPLYFILSAFFMTVTSINADAATRAVVPDLAGMIYPSTPSSQHVHFGDPSSPYPTAYEIVTSSVSSAVCSGIGLCLDLKISSVFDPDPFFLHQYDAKHSLVFHTFNAYDPDDILPLIPDNEAVVWRFQSNTTTMSTEIDLLLRLRQRSQRLSARDQLLVAIRVQVVDSRTITSAIETYSVYGNQRVAHTTHRANSNTIQVLLNISKNPDKPGVGPMDAYPLITAATFAGTDNSSTTGSSCDACDEFLITCQTIDPCRTTVLPCLIFQLEALASGGVSSSNDGGAGVSSSSQSLSTGDVGSASGNMEAGYAGSNGAGEASDNNYDLDGWDKDFFTGSGSIIGEESVLAASNGDASSLAGSIDSAASDTETGEIGKKHADLLVPLATCVHSHPTATWSSIRQLIFCLARSKCELGGPTAGGGNASTIVLTNGTQKIAVAPVVSGTDNVELSIQTQDIRPNTGNPQTFTYSASASYLGMFLRSFVLLQAVEVSISMEPYIPDPNLLKLSLMYSNALMLNSLSFSTSAGQLIMVEDSPPQVFIEYPAALTSPVVDTLLSKLKARVKSPNDPAGASHSWILADECLSCSSELFQCPPEAIADFSCHYNGVNSAFSRCIQHQLPSALFAGIIQGSLDRRPVATEMSQCMNSVVSDTDEVSLILTASSSLSCFAETRCPFGPVALIQASRMVVLETSSYVQLLRISAGASVDTLSVRIAYSVWGLPIATTTPIRTTDSELEIEDAIDDALSLTGISSEVRMAVENARSEWNLEITYRHVFLPSSFIMTATASDDSVKISGIKQVVMEGGPPQLRVVPRDDSKIYSLVDTSPSSDIATFNSSSSESESSFSW